ncbi:endonuclease/exonuclease/phosphatase family protein [Nocardioides astragali]|uniref:Endonuclease/exonuclease/phosphatase family protein n=1 Tax=Nocardioides astragali TaxID=1776736 RepID=A0ABW2NBX6_9ACTN|nr:endonuclease/exonuclease/phosphatase family protein [Nocardioides astragali]
MRLPLRSWAGRAAVAAAGISVAVAAAGTVPAQARPDDARTTVTVMTRNVYLGVDIQRPIRATAGKTGLDALVALGNSNVETRSIVDQTNFPRRSELLAAEIARTRPDLVGLQEVALWRSGPLELPPPFGSTPLGTPNAQEVDYDYLQLLLQDLRQEGVPYKAVVVQDEMDLESPAFLGNPALGTVSQGRDIRLTMRDVILLRASSTLRVLDKGSAQYDTKVPVNVGGSTLNIIRGYGWVDVAQGSGTSFRFVNTHLEAFSSLAALGQTQELLAETTAADRTTVIACDCNSDPLNNTTKPTDPIPVPHSAPYRLITGAGGFTDMWLEWLPANQGWTSGLNERVDEPAPGSWTHRIDMVFARPGPGQHLDVVAGEVTGDEPAAKDPATGLWPSDHAGVVLTISGARS